VVTLVWGAWTAFGVLLWALVTILFWGRAQGQYVIWPRLGMSSVCIFVLLVLCHLLHEPWETISALIVSMISIGLCRWSTESDDDHRRRRRRREAAKRSRPEIRGFLPTPAHVG
jgi:hypothetical protein